MMSKKKNASFSEKKEKGKWGPSPDVDKLDVEVSGLDRPNFLTEVWSSMDMKVEWVVWWEQGR